MFPFPQFELTSFPGFSVLKTLSSVRALWLMVTMQSSGGKIRCQRRNYQYVLRCFNSNPYLTILHAQGTLPFISTHLLCAWLSHEGAIHTAIHTAIDDLESFLWVFVWVLVHVLRHHKGGTKNRPAIEVLFDAFSGRSIKDVLIKEIVVLHMWRDDIFKPLIKEWLDICHTDQQGVHPLVIAMSSTTGHLREEACDRLEVFCRRTYEKVLNSGYRHLVNIRQYPDWEAVVAVCMG